MLFAMAPSLWLAVDKRLVGGYKEQRKVCLDGASSLYRWHFGLCEKREDAINRSNHLTGFKAERETHMLLQITFTDAGWLHYTMTGAGKDHKYVPLLHKKTVWSDCDVDPGQWRFHTHIPLTGGLLVTRWHEF